MSRATAPLAFGALGTSLGIAASVLGAEDVGASLTLVSAVLLLAGLHRYGRLGPDPAVPLGR